MNVESGANDRNKDECGNCMPFLLFCVWLINGCLITCAVFMYLNWVAVDWMVGSQGGGIAMAVLVSILLIGIIAAGCCVVGCRQHMERTHITINHEKGWWYVALIGPIVCFAVFITLCLFALLNTPVTTSYIQKHSDDVFRQADYLKDNHVTQAEFVLYMKGLPQYKSINNSISFESSLVRIFDALDTYQKGYLLPSDMFKGVLDSLRYIRQDFGITTACISFILVIFYVIFWMWHTQLRGQKMEERVRRLAQAATNKAHMDQLRGGDVGEENVRLVANADSDR